ncbi:DUF5667 domain-containing protein [Yinghuangia soli]|uniref:DUF5667 domain-containing protein n=1 Tax=Yinghuangia soli TaxID=2908204 RepID=A0AA41U0C0_9ACTN|nr:DUF5667 domain-containing protein [Yinghuangia soli]MCF2528436.1 DUF5667 domain-containing protein [Yinghuangia soli]
MSIAVVDRRRVLAFAEALEQIESGTAPRRGATRAGGDGHGGSRGSGGHGGGGGGHDGDGHDDASDDAGLHAAMRAVAMLHAESAAGPAPSADFRTALRSRLLDEASALPAAVASVPAPRGAHRKAAPVPRQRTVRWRRRCAVAGTVLVFTAGGLGGIAVASSDALPGDMTYGVKRAVEDIQISMAGSDRERGERYLAQARTRLAEAERLLDRDGDGAIGKSTIGHLRNVLDDMRSETENGRALLTRSYQANQAKIGPMRDLADFARTGTERMERIDARLPGDVATERNMVWNLLLDIHRQVAPIPGVFTPKEFEQAGKGATTGPGRGTTPVVPGQANPSGGATVPPAAGADGLVPPLAGQPGGVPAAPGASTPPAGGGILPSVNVPLLEPTPAATDSPSQSPSPVGVEVPAPVLPPVGLSIPPLLPGLPGIGITIGGPPATENP